MNQSRSSLSHREDSLRHGEESVRHSAVREPQQRRDESNPSFAESVRKREPHRVSDSRRLHRPVPLDVGLALAMGGRPTRIVEMVHRIAEREFDDRERLNRGEARHYPRQHMYSGLAESFNRGPRGDPRQSPLEKMHQFDKECDDVYQRNSERYYID